MCPEVETGLGVMGTTLLDGGDGVTLTSKSTALHRHVHCQSSCLHLPSARPCDLRFELVSSLPLPSSMAVFCFV